MSLNICLVVLLIVSSVLELLVINEETVILVCFVSFLVFFYRAAGSGITLSLDDHGSKIHSELVRSVRLWRSAQEFELSAWRFVLGQAPGLRAIFVWLESTSRQLFGSLCDCWVDLLSAGVSDRLSVLFVKESSALGSIKRDLVSSFFANLWFFKFCGRSDDRWAVFESLSKLRAFQLHQLECSSGLNQSLVRKILMLESLTVKLCNH
uniref:ATP synthase F0 subunit b n=1 Tax=Haptophyceae sp. NIES-3900 TaxID=2748608 RepID=A0A7R6WEE4_9EUKA|nr:ATP synthase F0 subunit b [Haptophyceae sp. NIES-3900]